MEIRNSVIGVKIRLSDFLEIIFSSHESVNNHIGLKVGDEYNFFYHEGLADFAGTLNEFTIKYNGATPEIYLLATCLRTGRERKVEIKDLARITLVDD